MAAMRDETPLATDDQALRAARARHGETRDEGRVSLATEERMARRRERFEACAPVAEAILEEARTTLAVRFRFLDRALWRMPLMPLSDLYGIASDGRSLAYDPVYVVDRFRLSPNEVVRDVAHCLFHCLLIFRTNPLLDTKQGNCPVHGPSIHINKSQTMSHHSGNGAFSSSRRSVHCNPKDSFLIPFYQIVLCA